MLVFRGVVGDDSTEGTSRRWKTDRSGLMILYSQQYWGSIPVPQSKQGYLKLPEFAPENWFCLKITCPFWMAYFQVLQMLVLGSRVSSFGGPKRSILGLGIYRGGHWSSKDLWIGTWNGSSCGSCWTTGGLLDTGSRGYGGARWKGGHWSVW